MKEKAAGENTDYDVIVTGGGIAGAFAAMGASVRGLRVLLIEKNASLGGQGTVTGERQFCGDVTHVNRPFQDILAELERYGALRPVIPTRGGTGFNGEILAYILLEKLLGKGVDVLFHTTLVDASCSGGKIDSIRITNKSGLQTLRARYWVDCTGDGDLAALAGFPTVKGGDVLRPDGTVKPDIQLQLPMSLCFYIEDTGSEVTPVLPEGCPSWKNDDELPMTTVVPVSPHTCFVKMKVIGGDVTVGSSYSEAEIEARRVMMGLVYHLQTKGYMGKVYDTYTLRHVCPGLGIREGRRIVGEYVLTEGDLRKGRHFPDAVAVGTYQIDYHWPDVLQRAGTGITDQVPPYHIPYRCLIPRGAMNLAVAGRCVSGDQMAMASFRVMSTCAQTGLAAGMACDHAVVDGVDLPNLEVEKLQEDLMDRGLTLDTTPYRRFRRQRRKVRELVIPEGWPEQGSHASTLLELENSETLVAWYAGDPGNNAIWSSRRVEEAWGKPEKLVDEGPIAHWNPVLFRDPRGDIHLFYRIGEAAERAKSRVITSTDGGHSWSDPVDIVPGCDSLRGPSKNKVIVLDNGDWLAPSSVIEDQTWGAVVDISENGGETWERSEVVPLDREEFEGRGAVQPTLWESAPGIVHMLLRSTSGLVLRSDSGDGGRTWSPAYSTGIPNSESGIDLAVMENGELALVHNPVGKNRGKRTPLVVSLSEDNGLTWPYCYALEEDISDTPDVENEFSYPAVIRSPEGISLTYTWKRRNIAFWRLSIEHLKDLP